MRLTDEAARYATELRARAEACFQMAKSFPPSAAADVTEAMGRAYASLADRMERGEVLSDRSVNASVQRSAHRLQPCVR
jgi:hypothetical protein